MFDAVAGLSAAKRTDDGVAKTGDAWLTGSTTFSVQGASGWRRAVMLGSRRVGQGQGRRRPA